MHISSIKLTCVFLGLLLGASSVFPRSLEIEESFLFCLTPSEPPLKIENRKVLTNNPQFQKYLEDLGMNKIEPWIMGTTDMDRDGEIILNRIYRVYLNLLNRNQRQYIIQQVDQHPKVIYAEPEYKHQLYYTPNDPEYDAQCNLDAVNAGTAWDQWNITDGDIPNGSNVLLASVDTGVDYTHPDLQDNVWINQGEIPDFMFQAGIDIDNNEQVTVTEILTFIENNLSDYNNDGLINLRDMVDESSAFADGSDNDGNGYIDDFLGWDTSGFSGTDDNDPFPIENVSTLSTWNHGTHVAGILAAVTDNNIGIASTSFNAKLLSIKSSRENDDENVYVSDGYPGITYAAKVGYYANTLTIINCSWGSYNYSNSDQAVINVAHNTYGAVIVGAAGNGEIDDEGINQGSEYSPHYPSSYDNVISVSPVDCSGNWGNWATYHPTIDLAAPGETVLSTIIGDGYKQMSGSSMAAPNVASCLGLLRVANPSWTNIQLEERILETADDVLYTLNPEMLDCNGEDGVKCLGVGLVDINSALISEFTPNIVVYESELKEIIGDSDYNLNPGETIEISVSLQNKPGWGLATNINAILSCDTDDITVDVNIIEIDSLNAGSTSGLLTPFQISISQGADIKETECQLEVTANPDIAYTTSLSIPLTITLNQKGFPLSTNVIKSAPMVIDLDQDGNNELIYADNLGNVIVLNADGSAFGKDSLFVNTGNDIWGSPAAADIDLDGDLDIVISSKSKFLYVFDHTGLHTMIELDSYLMATPALGQLDEDDELEILIGGYSTGSQKMFAVNHDGSAVSGFPINTGRKVLNGIALVDIDENGLDDIIFGSDDDDITLMLDDGSIQWSYDEIGSNVQTAPSVYATDTGFVICAGSDDGFLYCLDEIGALQFSVESSNNVTTSPSFIKIANDPYVFFGSENNSIYAVDLTGATLSGWPQTTTGDIIGSIVFADVDGDSLNEVISVNSVGDIYVYELDGSILPQFPISTDNAFTSPPTIADVDGDTDLEIIAGSTLTLEVIDLKTLQEDVSLSTWHTYRGNSRRTGFYNEVYGCLNENACDGNNLAIATVDDGSCLYEDCAGVCGGNSKADTCGICDEDTANNDEQCSIWPGDTDNSCRVDSLDVLPIGINWESYGSARAENGYSWESVHFPDSWENTSGARADTNGDGVVNIHDVLPILVNYGKDNNECDAQITSIYEQGYSLEEHRENFRSIYGSLDGTSIAGIQIRNLINSLFGFEEGQPQSFQLYHNFPNPFNPNTTIHFYMPEATSGTLTVYDLNGKMIEEMDWASEMPQDINISWSGHSLSSGIYFYRIESNSGHHGRGKMLLLK